MIIKAILRKLKRKRYINRIIENGSIYHKHNNQIVVPKNELLIQLRESDTHDNLMKLLIFGRQLHDFETRLVRASLKFEFIGSLTYPDDIFRCYKPHPKVYMKELFQGSYETISEVKERIEALTGEPVSDEFAKRIFRKLVFVINTCCPIMADTFEIWEEHTYRCFIEYAIDNNDFDFSDKCSIRTLFPDDIPYSGSLRSFVLKGLPYIFVKNVCHENYNTFYDNIRN